MITIFNNSFINLSRSFDCLLPFSVPAIDVSIVEKVLQSRKNGEEVNSEDFEKFKSVINSLHQQADEFGKQIETLLPEDKRRE